MSILKAWLNFLETLEFLSSPFMGISGLTLIILWHAGVHQGIPPTCLTLTCLCFIGLLFLYDEGKL